MRLYSVYTNPEINLTARGRELKVRATPASGTFGVGLTLLFAAFRF